MSASVSTTPAAPARSRLYPLRLLAAVAFAALGFAVVWQGFGLAGYGTDAHAKRASWACFQLLGFGLVAVALRAPLLVRVLVALVGLGSAGLAWWTVRSSNEKSAVALCEAVESRDRYRELLATATVEDIERHEGLRGINLLVDQYPSLAAGMPEEHDRWKERMWRDLSARFNQTPPDDVKTALALRSASQSLGRVAPSAGALLERSFQQWAERAAGAKVAELVQNHGDWEAFDRTAPGRKVLAEAAPETRAELVAAEEEWAQVTALGPVLLQVARGERPRGDWRGLEQRLLALPSLDTGERRFAGIRKTLFDFAHDQAQADVAAQLDAGNYDRAFGIARKHAVDWHPTAKVLGAEELAKLDTLRTTCAGLAAFAAKAAPAPDPIDVAPAPRPRPEK